MSSSPQKSPSSPKAPTPKSPSSRKKDESFLGKLGGTLARRQKKGIVWKICLTERDAFDTLFDHEPDKLDVVKKANSEHICEQALKQVESGCVGAGNFADGVYLVLLMGLLEGYFVPLYNFFLIPESFDHKVHNVSFSFELMQDGDLEKPKPRPEDILNCDLKSMLRVLYKLFTKYRNV